MITRFVFLLFSISLANVTAAIDKSILYAEHDVENGERRIVVVIGSYNNKQWYKKNLDSLFNQNYQNYRIIYIDDCSKDGTGDLVQAYIKEQGQEHRVLLIKNSERRYKMANMYRAYHLCNDRDLLIELDGDDWVCHNDVLARYNEIYSDPNVWMTYGHYSKWPNGEPQYMNEIPDTIIQSNSFRKFKGRCWEGLRTYYAWLVKQIKVEDFLYKGRFMARTSDVAIMFPMFEMAGSRFKLLTEMMMQHNNASNLNDYKVDGRLQYETYLNLMRRLVYQPLSSERIDSLDVYKDAKVDLIIYSRDPAAAQKAIQSIGENISSLGIITIVNKDTSSYLSSMMQCVVPLENKYVIFADDESQLIAPINLAYCIARLEQTKADAFFFTLGVKSREVSINNFIEDDVYLSQFFYMHESLKKFAPGRTAMYRTSELKKLVKNIDFKRVKQAEKKIAHIKLGGNKTALFFREAKAI